MTAKLATLACAFVPAFWAMGIVGGPSAGQALAQPQGVTVAAPMDMVSGADPEEAVAAMQRVREHVRGSPGLIGEELLQSGFPDAGPSHIHVTYWETFDDWEALFQSPELLALLEETAPFFTVVPARAYTAVE